MKRILGIIIIGALFVAMIFTYKENIREAEPGEEKGDYISSQLKLLADEYENCLAEYYEELDQDMNLQTAVTDLNHNGRLEMVLSDCQGSGAFSFTSIYEVSEDYASLKRMAVDGLLEMDTAGDFITIDSYDCYKKDGKYYYLIADYMSAGWNLKEQDYYSYSFDEGVTRQLLGGYVLEPEEEPDKKIKTRLYGAEDKTFSDGDSFYDYMDSVWEGYDRQPDCQIMWIKIEENDNRYDLLSQSFNGFNPGLGQADTNIDFTEIYGREFEYIIGE